MDQVAAKIFAEHGIERYGWTALKTPITFAYYEQWLNQGFHGTMNYLVEHAQLKRNPREVLPLAQSALVFAIPYWPEQIAPQHALPQALNVARYARGADYHRWLKTKLNHVIEDLKRTYPTENFLAFVDSGPVLERDLAVRAGLGWVGKNTCLISEKTGSFFFIAEIYTTLSFSMSFAEAADRCGTCTRCIDACPTGALVAPRVLDATRCLSYLTIEAKADPSIQLRGLTAGQFYGCDICQEVCPWNIKAFPGELKNSAPPIASDLLMKEISEILSASHSQLEKRFQGTALLRARPWMHKRNAIWMAVHYKLSALRPQIQSLEANENLSEFIKWALTQLDKISITAQ